MKIRSIGAAAAGVFVNLLAIPVDLALQSASYFPAAENGGEGPYALGLLHTAKSWDRHVLMGALPQRTACLTSGGTVWGSDPGGFAQKLKIKMPSRPLTQGA